MADIETEIPRRNSLLGSNENGSDINTYKVEPDESPTVAEAPTFRCEQCNNFETHSHSLLLVHVINCESKAPTNEPDPSPKPTDGSENESRKHHTLRKLFECDVCNMKFSNGANMRRHKMRHTGVKPYECRVCQKRFFRKDHLAEHFTTHTKTLPFHCPVCNRGFQRQIAMRAHFQNEHVGQHDLVKTCPMCSYRAGTMKSLRVHFFNRHGIDLDNPGAGSPTSLLLALNANKGQPQAMSTSIPVNYSDSGESFRSVENATPPLNLLTPQVEILTSDNEKPIKTHVDDLINMQSEDNKSKNESSEYAPTSPYVDCNSNNPSTSVNLSAALNDSVRCSEEQNSNAPNISLIPIEEDSNFDDATDTKNETTVNSSNVGNPAVIQISPLKSLLREDLKRRICSRNNNRFSRFSANGNNNKTVNNIDNEIPDASKCLTTFKAVFTTNANQDKSPLSTIQHKKILPCFFCGIEFPDQTLYFLHKGCHSESNPWKCNICGEQCSNVYEFNSHLLSRSHQ